MFKACILLLLVVSVFSQEVETPELNKGFQDNAMKIKEFIKCLKSQPSIGEDVKNLIEVCINGNYREILEAARKLITNEAVAKCISILFRRKPIVPQVELTYNWDGLVKCLQEAKPSAPKVINLIQLIKAKKYGEAVEVGIALLADGVQIFKKCKEFFKP